MAVLAQDVVAGQALELLLQSAGYSTRFMVETVADTLNGMLDGVQLLLLAPALSARHRDEYLDGMRSMPATAKIPVLELVTTLDGSQAEQECHVPWPCRMEYLKGKIEAALMNGPTRLVS